MQCLWKAAAASVLFHYTGIKNEQPRKCLIYPPKNKGSLITNLQGILQPLAVHHQPLLLGMLSSHLVEDIHRVLPQRTQETWNTERKLDKNDNTVLQNHLVGYGIYQEEDWIRKQYSCLVLVQLPSFRSPLKTHPFIISNIYFLARLCVWAKVQNCSGAHDQAAWSALAPAEVLLNQVFIHVPELLLQVAHQGGHGLKPNRVRSSRCRVWMKEQSRSLTSSVDLEGSLCLVDMLLTWLSTSVFNWNDSVWGLIMKLLPSELQWFPACQRGARWCCTFFPSVSKAERISRQRKLWACTSCKGRVLLNWLSPITFWVWSRSTAHFSSVGSLEITDRRYSKSFTTTHNCMESWSMTLSFVSRRDFSPLALHPPCWWRRHGRSSQTAAGPSALGSDSSSPLSCTHPVEIEKAW